MRDLLVASLVFGSLRITLKRSLWGILMVAGFGYTPLWGLVYRAALSKQAR